MPVILKLEDRTGEMFKLLKQSTLLFILQATRLGSSSQSWL